MNIDWTWLLVGVLVGYFGKSAIGGLVGKAKGAVGV